MDIKVRDYVAAVITVRDLVKPIADVTARDIEGILREFESNPDARDLSLDLAKIDPDRGAARRKVDELFPFLRGRSEEAHALPVISPAIPEDTRGAMLAFVRGTVTFDARIEAALDGLGIRKGETFSIVIRRIS